MCIAAAPVARRLDDDGHEQQRERLTEVLSGQ